MFPMRRCTTAGCGLPAVWDRPTCAAHVPDGPALAGVVAACLAGTAELRGLSLSGLTLQDLDLRGRRLEFCDFGRSRLERLDLSGCRMRFVYFDFAVLSACNLRGADIGMCVFAGAQIDGCDFSGSEVIQANFLGASCRSVQFGDSDLYSSRFIGARFSDVDMRNCNLKEVHFDRPEGLTKDSVLSDALRASGLDVRSSNAAEAVYGGER